MVSCFWLVIPFSFVALCSKNLEMTESQGAREMIQQNKRRAKETYKDGKKNEFLIHELVMRKVYNPASPLHPTFSGPYRIIEIRV